MNNRLSRFIIICVTITVLASCRLIQSTSDGGSIVSASGESDCRQGPCIVEMFGHFMETYTAVPDPGYFFVGWEKGCSGKPLEPCVINFPEILTNLTGDIELVAQFQRKEVPEVTWELDLLTRNSVTDLAGCIESVLACLGNETLLGDCFTTEVSICAEEDPTEGCCMQACSDQLTALLDSGASEQNAFLAVFVNDGSCMPGIEAWTEQ